MHILVIEDNSDIAANIGDYLEDRGHTVDFAADGVTGLHLAIVHDFDAIVLDLNLPGMDGLEVCRKLRNEARKQTPVLMLTARDTLDNKLAGFESGADDYLIKPFDSAELKARIRALLRRSARAPATPGGSERLRFGQLEIDRDARSVSVAGQAVELTSYQFDLLVTLAASAGRVLTREQIEQHLYKWGSEVSSNAVEVHVHNLRRKLGPSVIETVRGVGYVSRRPAG